MPNRRAVQGTASQFPLDALIKNDSKYNIRYTCVNSDIASKAKLKKILFLLALPIKMYCNVGFFGWFFAKKAVMRHAGHPTQVFPGKNKKKKGYQQSIICSVNMPI